MRPVNSDAAARPVFSDSENDARIRLTCPSSLLAVSRLASSAIDRKMRERSVCSSARHDSPSPSTDRSDEMLCVATIGMQRDWRVRANAFSSPAGSSSPVVTNDWYSSQMNTAGRKYFFGFSFIAFGRSSSVDSHADFSITPAARASAGFVPPGMFSASTFPVSIVSSSGGIRRLRSASVICSGFFGQKTRATRGSTKIPRNTDIPSTIDERSFSSRPIQSFLYHWSIFAFSATSSSVGPFTGCRRNSMTRPSLRISHNSTQ